MLILGIAIGSIVGVLVGMYLGWRLTLKSLDEEGWLDIKKLEDEYGPEWGKRFRSLRK